MTDAYVDWYRRERRQDWRTPQAIFDTLHAEYRFSLDGALVWDRAAGGSRSDRADGGWMTNEPAERLRKWITAHGIFDYAERDLDEALAAERRATVERIRAKAPNYPLNFRRWLDAILDAEAER